MAQAKWLKNKLIVSLIILVVLIVAFLFALFANNSYKAEEVVRLCDTDNPCNLMITTDKQVYAQGEPVKVRISNDTAGAVEFDQSMFWQIATGNDLTVYRPEQIVAQGWLGASETVRMTRLGVGEYMEWLWLQDDVVGNAVAGGIYVARIVDPKFSGASKEAYFTIEGGEELDSVEGMQKQSEEEILM